MARLRIEGRGPQSEDRYVAFRRWYAGLPEPRPVLCGFSGEPLNLDEGTLARYRLVDTPAWTEKAHWRYEIEIDDDDLSMYVLIRFDGKAIGSRG